jgi:FSR family fosmidomycin resistance protein-like MFS transporter
MLPLVLGLMHGFIDAASAAVLYSESLRDRLSCDGHWWLVVVYNALAFGLQLPMGLLVDRLKMHRGAGGVGTALLLIAAATCEHHAFLPGVLAGLGNALFHVGAGAIVLLGSCGRATAAGIFVAPGALGLTLGIWLGVAGFPHRWAMGLALLAGGLFLAWLPATPCVPTCRAECGPLPNRAVLCVVLVVVAIALRSFSAAALTSSWGEPAVWALVMTLCAVAGKAMGGFVGDQLGWRRVAVTATVLVTLLSWPAFENRWTAAAAMFLLQISMTTTLAAILVVLPNHPGTAFGIASLALLIGAMPGLRGNVAPGDAPMLLLAASCASAVALFIGLGFVARRSRRIESAGVPGMAAADAADAPPGAAHGAVLAHGADEIGAAGRLEAATAAHQRAQKDLIQADQPDQAPAGHAEHKANGPLCPPNHE